MTASNVDRVRATYEAFADGDVDVLADLLAEDAVWVESEGHPYGGRYRGAEAVLEGVFAPVDAEWTDYAVVPERFLDCGDVVVVLGEYAGTYVETGRRVEAPFAHLWEFEGETVVYYEQFTDTALFREAVEG